MPFRRFLFALAVSVGLSPAHAQDPVPSDPSAGVAAAFERLERGDFLGALDAAERDGPVARDIVEWLRLREGVGTFSQALSFLRRNADWPGLALLRRRMESTAPESVTTEETAQKVIDFFADADPATGRSILALVEAYRVMDRDGDAQALAALSWVERSMTASAEERLLQLYPDVLEPLAEARLEQMYWDGAEEALARAVSRGVSDDAKARIDARLAARAGRVPDDLPDALKKDAGIGYEAFRRAVRAKDWELTAKVMLRQSVSAETLGRPELWAAERRDLTRRLMRAGDHDTAYALASSHWLEPDVGYAYSDLEWLSGYLSLRFLDQPERALAHFRRFAASVTTPISLGRAGYWIGRAAEALDRPDEAEEAYAFGAQYQTSFYGLLAAEKLGQALDPVLTGREVYPLLSEASFQGSGVLEAALLLQAAGQRDMAETFLTHLAESLDAPEIGTLAQLTLDLGEPHLALLISKRAARRGITLPRPYYPVIDVGVANNPVEDALALSIARRESEFDPGVSSGVGARGLMQLMPGTAREVAQGLGLRYSAQRLFSDPSYNATLGTAYLAGLMNRFGDNPVLVSSGYNAGPGRPASWIRERGDPRAEGVDVIDWIEMIPFDETRNYAMRVAESIPVYRARLTGEAGPLEFTAMLKGR